MTATSATTPTTTAATDDSSSPADIAPRGWLVIAKAAWAEATNDNISLIAAGVAFYGFLAFVPLLAAMVLAYGLVVDPAQVAKHMHAMTTMVPADAAKLIDQQLKSIVKTAATKKGLGLLFALLFSLYGTMKGAGAVVTALDIAYEVDGQRSFLRATLVNAGVAVGAILVAIGGLMAASVTGYAHTLATHWSSLVATAVTIASWLGAAALASLAVAALYRYAPDRREAAWVWLTPGAIVATLGLIAMTVGFGFYAAHFGNYNATYGALGAVVVLLMWLYLSAYILLLGAELNSELEKHVAPAKP